MLTQQDIQPPSFFKAHILPALCVLAIPLFSLWFFSYAEQKIDGVILQSVTQDSTLSADEKADLHAFYSQNPLSKIMASDDPELADLRQNFADFDFDFTTFRWAKRLSIISLTAFVIGLLIAGLFVLYSLRSHAAQYTALKKGLPMLKVISAIQVIAQSILAVALSYWVTALWFGEYYPQLIIAIAVLALIGVIVIIKGLFSKPDTKFEIEGDELSNEDAPELWSRIQKIAGNLGTAPPDRIVAGIDASFYVTEHPVYLKDKENQGRTLYLSLPLLNVLSTGEADAVLGHEMAHFSGDDTFWSNKVGPLLQKMEHYMSILAQGGLTIVAFLFLEIFWKLYQISLGKLSREREFRADKIGAETSSASDLACALIKIGAYSKYQFETEMGVIEKDSVDTGLELSDTLKKNFPAYLTQFASDKENILNETPHPFDSHPTIERRLENLALKPDQIINSSAVQTLDQDSWRKRILTADAIEGKLWKEREQMIQEVHSTDLAWRLLPDNEKNIEAITSLFPTKTYSSHRKGDQIIIDYEKISLLKEDQIISFSRITNISVKEALVGQQVKIAWLDPSSGKKRKSKFNTSYYRGKEGILEIFETYYGRYENAAASNAESQPS